MIGRITGILLEKQAPELLVDAQGVGYEVQVSLTTFFTLPEPGARISLHTHFVVREDAQQLYGFADTEERQLFRHLIRISGVGPKMALAILSGMTAPDFVRCVQGNDSATLVRLPGVGKKTAERLLVEMRDRLADWGDSAAIDQRGRDGAVASSAAGEAESALMALGYKPQEAARMVGSVLPADGSMPASEDIIRRALKSVVKK